MVRRLVDDARSRGLSYNLDPGVKTKAPRPRRSLHRRANVYPSRPVVVAGEVYESLSDAARRFGVHPGTIQKRVRSATWPEYQYAEAV